MNACKLYIPMQSLTLLVVIIVSFYLTGCKKEVFQNREKPQLIIAAGDPRLQENTIHFYADTVYVLASNLIIDSGKTLAIDAGTIIKVNNRLSVDIQSGAKIEAKGTADNPIIFTSAAGKGGAGVGTGSSGGERWWYGVRIYGNPALDGSGSLSYVRIEFAGGNLVGGAASPAMLLQQVTAATTIDHIQVSYSFSESSFDISGGDVNATHLVSYASAGTDFHINNGYTGKLQYLLAYRHPYFPFSPVGPDFGGMLIEGAATFPVISNLSVIGPDLQKGLSIKYNDTITSSGAGKRAAALIVKGGKFHISNSVFMGFPRGGFYLDDRSAAIALNDRVSTFTHSIVHSTDSARAFYLGKTVFPPFESKHFRDLMMNPDFDNMQVLHFGDFMLTNPFDYDLYPDPFPQPGSLLLNGAVYDGAFTDPFFKQVSWRGALGTDNWLQNWSNFIPLQTEYNN
jgi:hypothetical protein